MLLELSSSCFFVFVFFFRFQLKSPWLVVGHPLRCFFLSRFFPISLRLIIMWCRSFIAFFCNFFTINYQFQYLPHWCHILLSSLLIYFFVFFEQITTLISGTFLINIKVNFLNFNQVFSNVTPCIFTFFRSWFILIRFYLKYFSPQVNVMFISPSHRS